MERTRSAAAGGAAAGPDCASTAPRASPRRHFPASAGCSEPLQTSSWFFCMMQRGRKFDVHHQLRRAHGFVGVAAGDKQTDLSDGS
ncbi:hypothetical protein OJAV_G00217020 [Oryzias javanicus]|uniref:Uncharacterized protein n=1 Tax=Oryzias javanicus TaxID=123683 RepID=A0A3S2MER6_ORYJA|nr:hypothetical protein OJAV_G00217020 [Oryzias javanicus]